MTYIFANTSPCTRTKIEHIPTHILTVAINPPGWPEFIKVMAKNSRIALDDSSVHTNSISLGDVVAVKFEASFRCMSRHSETNTGMKSHTFFDASAEEWKLNCFGILDRGAQLPFRGSVVNFRLQLAVCLWCLYQEVEDGTHCNGSGIRACKPTRQSVSSIELLAGLTYKPT